MRQVSMRCRTLTHCLTHGSKEKPKSRISCLGNPKTMAGIFTGARLNLQETVFEQTLWKDQRAMAGDSSCPDENDVFMLFVSFCFVLLRFVFLRFVRVIRRRASPALKYNQASNARTETRMLVSVCHFQVKSSQEILYSRSSMWAPHINNVVS